MPLKTSLAIGLRLHGAMKLAQLLELPEADVEAKVSEMERDPLFARLVSEGALALRPFPQAYFAARRFAGLGLRSSADGLPELADAQGDLAKLIARVGQDRFQEAFLSGAPLSDAARARLCGIDESQARRLRDFVDRLYVQAEFETPAPAEPAPRAFSAVAGIALEDGRPAIRFFHREIWKHRYHLDDAKVSQVASSLERGEAMHLQDLLGEVRRLEQRKTTLYRLLETLIEGQGAYLATGDPDRRRPLTQRQVSRSLGVSPSVLCRLISNKSVELPAGLEMPMRFLFPSAKDLLRSRLGELLRERKGLSDSALRRELAAGTGVTISRRSVAQYRKELGIAAYHPRECVGGAS